MSARIGIPGVLVGHSTSTEAGTGCTVVLVPDGAVASVDVRGGGPGTRETDILSPYSTVNEIHAVLLTGGSAFGLAAADGVVAYLEERDYGYQTPYALVPLVPAAVIYDLGFGHPHVRPRPEDGYRAAAAAAEEALEGSVGVGTGATVGKILGPDWCMKGGFAVSMVHLPSEVTVTALTVVNAFGDVVAEDGSILAGARRPAEGGGPGEGPRVTEGHAFLDTSAYLRTVENHPRFNSRSEHTTLSVVITDALLDKTECAQIARMAHDGLARAISPVHTPVDGDAVFVLSVGDRRSSMFQVGVAAAEAVAASIRRAVRLAEGRPGVPSVKDFGDVRCD
ncbi:MAG: P1 family peptidase [Thermoleophilia bacterium]